MPDVFGHSAGAVVQALAPVPLAGVVADVGRRFFSRIGRGDGCLPKDEVIIIDDNFNASGVRAQAFAKGARPAHEHATAFAKRIINRLDDAGVGTVLGPGPVVARRQDFRTGFLFGRCGNCSSGGSAGAGPATSAWL